VEVVINIFPELKKLAVVAVAILDPFLDEKYLLIGSEGIFRPEQLRSLP
jgi:hypothetical protein